MWINHLIQIRRQELNEMIELGYIKPKYKNKGYTVTSRQKGTKRKKIYVREDLYKNYIKYI